MATWIELAIAGAALLAIAILGGMYYGYWVGLSEGLDRDRY